MDPWKKSRWKKSVGNGEKGAGKYKECDLEDKTNIVFNSEPPEQKNFPAARLGKAVPKRYTFENMVKS